MYVQNFFQIVYQYTSAYLVFQAFALPQLVLLHSDLCKIPVYMRRNSFLCCLLNLFAQPYFNYAVFLNTSSQIFDFLFMSYLSGNKSKRSLTECFLFGFSFIVALICSLVNYNCSICNSFLFYFYFLSKLHLFS